MAITYDVKIEEDEAGGYAKGGPRDSFNIDFSVGYQVTVSDPENENFDPRTISVFEALNAPDLPRVNTTTYKTDTGLVIPYLVCRDKRGKRNPSVRGRFDVTTRWDSGQRADQNEAGPQVPPPDLSGYQPRVETQLGQTEWVRYSDKDNKQCLTPTGNQYDTPFVEMLATEIRRVTQYEAFVSYQDMRNRKFKMNSTEYRTEPAQAWFMTEVEGTEVQVELAAGPTTVAQMTYTMELTDRPGLWKESRALIDTHFYDVDNVLQKTAFTDDVLKRYTIGKVDDGGLPRTLSEPMLYDEWRMQDEIDFNSFLLA